MFGQSINNLIEQLKNSNSKYAKYCDKTEFSKLIDVIFKSEKLQAITVGGIESEPWLLVASDKRLIFIKKATIYGCEVREYGLEDIIDIQFSSHGKKASLIFELTQNKILKIDSIPHDEASEFGRTIASNVKVWNNNLTSYLL